jgi:hypothetical protein
MTTAIGDPEPVCAALASILNGLQVSVATTETYTVRGANPPPVKIDTAELPAAFAFTGQASDEENRGEDLVYETRQYAVQVAVIPVGQGTPAEREKRCRPVLIAVKNKLRQYPHLGVAGVQRMRVTGDSGVVVLPSYEGQYIGFEVRLTVLTLIKRTYADNE